MSQYIVLFILWFCICLTPIRYNGAKFGITNVASANKRTSVVGQLNFLSGSNILLFNVIGTILWSIVIFGYAVFQDLTFAKWTGSYLGLASLSIFPLIFGITNRYLMVRHIVGKEPTSLYDATEYVGLRPILVIAVVLLIFVSNITPLMGNLDFNPMFKDLNDSEDNIGEPENFLSNSDEVRVISWSLASQYLERSYGDSASSLNAYEYEMMQYTSPTIVNGEFMWINAPKFETWKWTGGKDVPFFVSVINDPANMSNEGFDPIRKSEKGFSVHVSQITWSNRIDQILFDDYALYLDKIQIRFDVDDSNNPFWIVYLGERGIVQDVMTLEKILIINARDINDYEVYDVKETATIPKWLEIVYPDFYVENWAGLWGEWREGIFYHMFTKTHLSYPSDSARFIVLNGETFWYVPMNQLSSNVLAGYILVDTRTGEATYYNREAKSLANLGTAWGQVDAYLASGAEGYSQLRIDEGYLYPVRTESGSIRDAYIFPLYSGFSIQKFAIVDAQEYTQKPVLETSLDSALLKYRSKTWGNSSFNETYDWLEWKIENGYCEDDECVITSNSSTYVVAESDLVSGAIDNAKDEWRELNLAISEFERTGNVTIFVTCNLETKFVSDVDYEDSDLINRKS